MSPVDQSRNHVGRAAAVAAGGRGRAGRRARPGHARADGRKTAPTSSSATRPSRAAAPTGWPPRSPIDGPIFYGDVSGRKDRDIILQHLGDDEDKGWYAFLAAPIDKARDCTWQWQADEEQFRAKCDGPHRAGRRRGPPAVRGDRRRRPARRRPERRRPPSAATTTTAAGLSGHRRALASSARRGARPRGSRWSRRSRSGARAGPGGGRGGGGRGELRRRPVRGRHLPDQGAAALHAGQRAGRHGRRRVGPDVAGVAVGDRVLSSLGLGAWTTHAVVPAAAAHRRCRRRSTWRPPRRWCRATARPGSP